MELNKKEMWVMPELKVYGDVKEVTRAQAKALGSSDGWVLSTTEGLVSITNAS